MITSRCIRICGVTTTVTTMAWFKSPCMCTTTGTMVAAEGADQRAEEPRYEDRR
jgi:hypothetical protein